MVSRKDNRAPCVALLLVGVPTLVAADGATHALERKDAALLALLASDGAVPRARLAALLWPDADAALARNSLRQRLFRLRRAAAADVVAGAAVLHLAEGVQHDLTALQSRLALDADAAQGDLLGSHEYADCPELSAWVDLARDQWRSARRDALAELAAGHEGRGDVGAALRYAQRLLAENPLLEHAQRRVMRLHYLRGDASAALVAHERAREALRSGLDAVPSRETEELAQLIRSGGALAPAAPPIDHGDPLLRPARLVGRGADQARLLEAIAARRAALIDGEAGIGKTRLLDDMLIDRRAPPALAARAADAGVAWALLAALVRHLAPRFPPLPSPWPARELARITPELGRTQAESIDALRLHRALAAALAHWAARGLEVVGIDDLHHADTPSLELLPALAAGSRVAWLLALRSAPWPPAVERWCSDAAAQAPVRITLGPLPLPDIERLLASLSLPSLDPQVVAAPLLSRAGGNPRWILDALRALMRQQEVQSAAVSRAPMTLPADTTAALLRQLERLPPLARKLARLAAVAGEGFDADLAPALLGADETSVADAWRQLEAAGLLRDGRFASELAREAVLQSIPTPVARLMRSEIDAHLGPPVTPASRPHS